MIFEEELFNFGMTGIFIAYLIYDRQILLRGFLKELKDTIKEMKGGK